MNSGNRAPAVPVLDYDILFQAYQSALAAYSELEHEIFPSSEIRLAIVSSMVAQAGRGELDPGRLSAVALSSLTNRFRPMPG